MHFYAIGWATCNLAARLVGESEGGREEKDGGNGKSTAAWRGDASCIVMEGKVERLALLLAIVGRKEGQKSKVKFLVKALWLNTRWVLVPSCFLSPQWESSL